MTPRPSSSPSASLVERVESLLEGEEDAAVKGGGGVGVSAALLQEEAALARTTNERLRKQVALMEEKCHELEKVLHIATSLLPSHRPTPPLLSPAHSPSLCLQACATLTADNSNLSLRFKHSCEARHRVEKKLKAVEAELEATRAEPHSTEVHVGWAR